MKIYQIVQVTLYALYLVSKIYVKSDEFLIRIQSI